MTCPSPGCHSQGLLKEGDKWALQIHGRRVDRGSRNRRYPVRAGCKQRGSSGGSGSGGGPQHPKASWGAGRGAELQNGLLWVCVLLRGLTDRAPQRPAQPRARGHRALGTAGYKRVHTPGCWGVGTSVCVCVQTHRHTDTQPHM